MLDASLASIIPQLSIGALAVCGFIYLMTLASKQSDRHTERMAMQAEKFFSELEKREHAMRQLEKEVRDTIIKQLSENSHLMTRIIDFLDQPTLREKR